MKNFTFLNSSKIIFGKDTEELVGSKEFFKKIGLPVTLNEAHISEGRFEEMADKCTSSDTKTVGNFVKLNKQDIISIYNLAK